MPVENNSMSLSQFEFSPTPTTPLALRRSHRKMSSLTQSKDSIPMLDSEGTPPQTQKRARNADASTSSRSPSKKPKRGYAAPELYAHLHVLQDYLKENLDVIFCGINPGQMSAEVGHHFANPTNHFWRCLHRSGFTTSQMPPTEDYTLPEAYCLGLTNLVDRPSAEQSELSSPEMADAVPTFLSKIARYRPRIVCFVGMGIWEIVEKTLLKISVRPEDHSRDATPSTSESSKRPTPSRTLGKRSPKSKKPTALGLRPYKMVHPKQENDLLYVQETYFFVTPSSSGRVTQYQFPDKVQLFKAMKVCLDDIKESKLDSTNMSVISSPDLVK